MTKSLLIGVILLAILLSVLVSRYTEIPEKCLSIEDKLMCDEECIKYREDCLIGTARNIADLNVNTSNFENMTGD